MEIFEQVPRLDAVVVPAAGHYGLLAGTAAAIKHLNSQALVIVSQTAAPPGGSDHLLHLRLLEHCQQEVNIDVCEAAKCSCFCQ